MAKYYADRAYANADKCLWPFDSHAKVAHFQMRVEYGSVLTLSRVMFNFYGNELLNISDNRKMILLGRQIARGTPELCQLLIKSVSKLDITIDINIVKISLYWFSNICTVIYILR